MPLFYPTPVPTAPIPTLKQIALKHLIFPPAAPALNCLPFVILRFFLIFQLFLSYTLATVDI